jgi:hypothetical protein
VDPCVALHPPVEDRVEDHFANAEAPVALLTERFEEIESDAADALLDPRRQSSFLSLVRQVAPPPLG